MFYERRASPLHAARAPVAAAYAIALVTAVLAFENPIELGAIAIAIVGAAVLAGAGRILLKAALYGVPFALMIALVNPLVTDEGLTVLARLGEVGPLGKLDVTLEGLMFGAVLGLRALLVVLASSALLGATVDADELLRGFRRISVRSALTAALAVRLVPVLGRDARRLADARRCRPGATPKPGAAERLQIVRAVATGALDRALDVAATLEVRGYATPAAAGGPGPHRRRRHLREPWSRHDLAFAASACALVVLAGGARLLGIASYDAYPSTSIAAGTSEWLLAAALVVVALLPFADRRGIDAVTPTRRCRSPTAGGSCDERAALRARHLPLPARERAGAARRVGRRRRRRVRRRGGAVGVGQVDVPARRVRPRPALPRRRVRRAASSPAASTRASTGRGPVGRRGHAVSGPRDAGRAVDRPRGARAAAGEPRPWRRRGRARRRGDGACARHRRAARALDARAVGWRAAARRARRGAGGAAAARAARRADLAAGSGRRRRARVAAAAPERGVGDDDRARRAPPRALPRGRRPRARLRGRRAGLRCPPRGFLEWAAERAPALRPRARGCSPAPACARRRAASRRRGRRCGRMGCWGRRRALARRPLRIGPSRRLRPHPAAASVAAPPALRLRWPSAACGSSAPGGGRCCAGSTSRSRPASASR